MNRSYEDVVQELYPEVADCFDIECDAYLPEVSTAGDLCDYIGWKLGVVRREAPCLYPPTFRALRQALAGQLRVPSRTITLGTPLANLIPLRGRRRKWRGLSATLGLEFPELRDIPGLVVLCGLLWACVVLPLSMWLLVALDVSIEAALYVGMPLILLSQIPFGIAMVRVSRALRLRFPMDCRTVGDLAGWLVFLNARQLREQFPARTPAVPVEASPGAPLQSRCTNVFAFLKLRKALAEATSIPPWQIRPETLVDTILGTFGRRTTWRIFRRSLGWELPGLNRSRLTVLLCWLGFPLTWLLGAFLLPETYRVWPLLVAYPFLVFVLTIPRAIHVPKDCATVSDLTRKAVTLNYGPIARANRSVNTDEIWSNLSRILAGFYQCDPDSISPAMPLFERVTVGQ